METNTEVCMYVYSIRICVYTQKYRSSAANQLLFAPSFLRPNSEDPLLFKVPNFSNSNAFFSFFRFYFSCNSTIISNFIASPPSRCEAIVPWRFGLRLTAAVFSLY